MLKVTVTKNDWDALARGIIPGLAKAVEATAQDIRTDAAGRNRTYSGTWTVDHRYGARKGGLQVTVGSSDWRAVFAEDGTPYIAATPMLRPALEAQKAKFFTRILRAFGG